MNAHYAHEAWRMVRKSIVFKSAIAMSSILLILGVIYWPSLFTNPPEITGELPKTLVQPILVSQQSVPSFAVPEFPLGTIGPLLAGAAGITYLKIRKRLNKK